MLPLRDDVPSRTVPLVTIGFIGANIVAFFYQVSLQLSPDPEALRAAREHLDGAADPGRTWVIGDTPLDVRCARAIGAKAAAVATGWHPREELSAAQPDLLLTDLADPAPLLDRIQ